jgi:hypothetical protein
MTIDELYELVTSFFPAKQPDTTNDAEPVSDEEPEP